MWFIQQWLCCSSLSFLWVSEFNLQMIKTMAGTENNHSVKCWTWGVWGTSTSNRQYHVLNEGQKPGLFRWWKLWGQVKLFRLTHRGRSQKGYLAFEKKPIQHHEKLRTGCPFTSSNLLAFVCVQSLLAPKFIINKCLWERPILWVLSGSPLFTHKHLKNCAQPLYWFFSAYFKCCCTQEFISPSKHLSK